MHKLRGTRMPLSLIVALFTVLAQCERRLILERTKAGVTAARARGRNGGRPAILPEYPSVVAAKWSFADKSMPVPDICRTSRVSTPTFHVCVALTRQFKGRYPASARRSAWQCDQSVFRHTDAQESHEVVSAALHQKAVA